METNSPPSSDRKVKFQLPDVAEEMDGIARKVVNIDGIPLLPRRGKFINSNSDVESKAKVGDNVQVSKADSESLDNNMVNATYAASLQSGMSEKLINFRFLESLERQKGVDVVLSRESVKTVQDKLAFTLYGYFIGDREAFPVVKYFVENNWKKYGLQKIMMNANGFFFFKFANSKGMLDVLEGGPWLIRNKPIFLNIWSPTTTLRKEDIKKVAVWVKLHDVPLAAYTDDGLSMLASKIGTPKLLDTYTSAMCSDAWGRSSYARALVEISAEHEFKEALTMAIPELEGDNYVTETIGVEYEWKPPRCAHCCVFGHDSNVCPIHFRSTSKPRVDGDDFTDVKGRKSAKKIGFSVNKAKPKFEYKPVDQKKKGAANNSRSNENVSNSSKVQTHNPFDVLSSEACADGSIRKGDLKSNKGKHTKSWEAREESEEEEVVEVYNETSNVMTSGGVGNIGASTSNPTVSNG